MVHTVGHSTRTLPAFLALLAAHRIGLVVDVRRWPTSRRHPHFGREALRTALAAAGIEYLGRVDLGGYRRPAPDSPHTAWRSGGFRGYADFMGTDVFARILAELEPLLARTRAALMCAEAVPWRCHRQLLADALVVRGWTVRHVTERGCEPHRLPPFARLEGGQLVYRG